MQPAGIENQETLLEVESRYYESKREEYVEKYPDKYVLIYGEGFFGAFNTMSEAIDEGVRKFGAGPFLVRKSGDDELVLSTFTLMMAR